MIIIAYQDWSGIKGSLPQKLQDKLGNSSYVQHKDEPSP